MSTTAGTPVPTECALCGRARHCQPSALPRRHGDLLRRKALPRCTPPHDITSGILSASAFSDTTAHDSGTVCSACKRLCFASMERFESALCNELPKTIASSARHMYCALGRRQRKCGYMHACAIGEIDHHREKYVGFPFEGPECHQEQEQRLHPRESFPPSNFTTLHDGKAAATDMKMLTLATSQVE